MIRGKSCIQIASEDGWVNIDQIVAAQPKMKRFCGSILDILKASKEQRSNLSKAALDIPTDVQHPDKLLMPFQPLSYRDFMIYEHHAVNAARGFAKRYIQAYPLTKLYEKITGRPFPAFRPKPLWYRQPIYYMGNHLAFVPDGSTIPFPDYCDTLDYELELGFVLAKPLLNASPAEAEEAIGGFVIFNDLSVRNVQIAEMNSGFGPQKSKHFCNIIGSEVVTPEEVISNWQSLKGEVRINGRTVAEVSSNSPKYSLGEMLAHASKGEQLFPGEFFGTGTLPGGCGMENGYTLNPNDQLELVLHTIGSLKSKVQV